MSKSCKNIHIEVVLLTIFVSCPGEKRGALQRGTSSKFFGDLVMEGAEGEGAASDELDAEGHVVISGHMKEEDLPTGPQKEFQENSLHRADFEAYLRTRVSVGERDGRRASELLGGWRPAKIKRMLGNTYAHVKLDDGSIVTHVHKLQIRKRTRSLSTVHAALKDKVEDDKVVQHKGSLYKDHSAPFRSEDPVDVCVDGSLPLVWGRVRHGVATMRGEFMTFNDFIEMQIKYCSILQGAHGPHAHRPQRHGRGLLRLALPVVGAAPQDGPQEAARRRRHVRLRRADLWLRRLTSPRRGSRARSRRRARTRRRLRGAARCPSGATRARARTR